MGWLPDVAEEMAHLVEQERRQQATASRVGVSYDTNSGNFTLPTEAQGARLFALVHDLTEYQKRYWWMTPFVQFALAKTGIAPDSETAKQAALIGAKIKADEGFGYGPMGKSVKAGLVAARIAASGQGGAYAGSYDWGNELALPDTDAVLTSRYGNSGATTTTVTRDGLDFNLDTEAARQAIPGLASSAQLGAEQFAAEAAPIREQAAARRDELLAASKERELEVWEKANLEQATGTAQNPDDRMVVERTSGLDPLTPFLRAGFMALDAPLQELQGQVRNVYAATQGDDAEWFESQSDLGIALGDLAAGEEVDVGTGIFVDPASEVAQERQKRIAERGLINGHGVTLGRWLADAAPDTIIDPDSTAYDVLSGSTDFLVALLADPSNLVLAKAAKVHEAGKLFTESGGILGLRKTVSPQAVESFWASERGALVARGAADLTQTYDVWEAFGRKLPPSVAAQIADEADPAAIVDILKPLSGGVLREKPNLKRFDGRLAHTAGGLGMDEIAVTRSAQSVRLGNVMPSSHVDLEDATESVVQTERFLRNVKAPDSMVYEMVDKMARAETKLQRREVIDEMAGGAKGLLVEKGFTPEQAQRLTKLHSDSTADARKYFVDEIGNTVNPWGRGVVIDGEIIDTPSPHLLVEHIDRMQPLPDARALRRATSKYSRLWSTENQQLRLPLAALQSFQDDLWKPATLIRGAWTVRVIGEEQLRMGAMGLDSIFSAHPLSAIAVATGKKGNLDITGNLLEDSEQIIGAMTRGSGGILHAPNQVITGDYKIVYKRPEEQAEFLRGWAGELAQLHADPVARAVASINDLDTAKLWFRTGNGSKVREELAAAGHDELLTTAGSDSYIESIAHRLSMKSGDSPDVMDALRNGGLGDVPMYVKGTEKINPEFVRALEAHVGSAPSAVKAPRMRFVKGDTIKERYDRGVETLFGFLMSKPTNWLSRAPAFKQFYWKRVEEMLPLMSHDAQRQVLAVAREAKVKFNLPARRTTGDLTLDEADFLAKGYGLDETKNLLYDLSQRSQFFDATRLIFPFGEAWKEVLTRWAKLLTTKPKNIRRFQQGIQEARQSGFFHKNDRGEEVFTYPGTEWLTSSAIGVPIPLVGRVEGLNMAAQMYPGVGPVAQFPMAWIIPDTPGFDALNEVLFPYGRPEDPLDWKTWAPGWLKRATQQYDQTDSESVRLFSNTIMDMARYLASTGDYDLHTPEGVSKLVEDAKDKAGDFNWIRAAAQWVAPSSPSPEFLVKDRDGRLIQTAILSQQYRAWQEEDPATASQKFLDTFGPEPFLLMQSKTQAVSYGYPVTSDGLTWMRENPDVEGRFPNVFGYFAPQGGEFDYNAYLRALQSGAKVALTPEQFVKLGNARLASIEYDKAKQQIADSSGGKPSDEQRAWLRQMKDALIREYPGYGESLDGGLGLQRRAEKPQQIRELTEAVKDPKLASTETGQALIQYLDARSKMQAAAEQRGLAGFQTAKSARDLRDWLRQMGEALSREHPNFDPLWDQLLEREMTDDTDVEEGER